MTRSPASRSGRPAHAAGSLASALLASVAAIGLGCASVGASASPPPYVAVRNGSGHDRGLGAGDGVQDLELRRASENAAPETGPNGETRHASENAAPEPPIVDATRRRPATALHTQPVRLRVAAVDIDVEIRPTGVADDGSMELPDTVRRAGWYRYSARPGDRAGRTVIAAHVDTRTEGLGPLARLTKVGKGDRIVISDRAGRDHRYRITSRRHMPRRALPVDDLFARDGAPGLVLLTCGGAYDARGGYRENVVVVAVPDR